MDKEFILAEIRRTAELNGGKPLGSDRLYSEAGIRPRDWRRHWVRFGDAVREAGLIANELSRANDINIVCEAYVEYAIELNRLPLELELVHRRRSVPHFPSPNAFKPKRDFVAKLADFCRENSEFSEVLRWCEEYLRSEDIADGPKTEGRGSVIEGYVYLAKTRRGYKIGRTDDWEQRLRQIQLHNADDVVEVHKIKTDDPSGVEAYWHRRFKSKRVVAKSKTGRRRNWYNLTTDDVRAFKRWRQI